MKDSIIQAILNRNVITFDYKGNHVKVEPFTIGIHKTTGNVILSAYFLSGYSKSQGEPPWRLYSIKNIANLIITNEVAESFHDGYNPRDSRMSTIFATVE